MLYEIPEANVATLIKRMERLSARTVRAGNPPVSARRTGNFRDVPHPTKPSVLVRMVEVEATVDAPAYNGWRFMAVICLTSEGNIIRAVPGYEVPAEHRDGEHRCDHCHTNRRRNDTYIVRHDDGRTLRVGSSCVQDFLQHSSAGQMTLAARLCFEASQMLEAAQHASWLGGSNSAEVCRIDLEVYLSYVAETVYRTGRYITSKAARETGGISTAASALNSFFHSGSFTVRDEARQLAQTAREWVLAAYGPRFDLEHGDMMDIVDSMNTPRKDCSDFEHNLLTAARLESIEPRFAGIAAYIIEAYRRSIPRSEAAQLNADGLTRIFAMFETAKKTELKRPAIRLTNDAGQYIRLSLAPVTSSNPGHIYVKGARTAEGSGDYFGKITPGGKFLGVRGCPPGVEAQLKAFAENPEAVASAYGKLTGCCCFCGRALTDDRSTEVGYGPVCADKFGLRWGAAKTVDENVVAAETVAIAA